MADGFGRGDDVDLFHETRDAGVAGNHSGTGQFGKLRDTPTPPTHHLPTEALTRLRELLLEELSVQIDQATEQGRTVAELKTDPTTSIGQFEVDWEIAEVMVASSQEAMDDIENALARMDAGPYGHCEQCAAPIPSERLEADPPHPFLCGLPGTPQLNGIDPTTLLAIWPAVATSPGSRS